MYRFHIYIYIYIYVPVLYFLVLEGEWEGGVNPHKNRSFGDRLRSHKDMNYKIMCMHTLYSVCI